MNIVINLVCLFGGVVMGIWIVAMLNANKHDDIEYEKLVSYKEGYEKGFDDGYELQKSHTK